MSFRNIQQWLMEVEEFSSSTTIPRVLVEQIQFVKILSVTKSNTDFQVGNKADLSDRREVESTVAEEFARQRNIR